MPLILKYFFGVWKNSNFPFKRLKQEVQFSKICHYYQFAFKSFKRQVQFSKICQRMFVYLAALPGENSTVSTYFAVFLDAVGGGGLPQNAEQLTSINKSIFINMNVLFFPNIEFFIKFSRDRFLCIEFVTIFYNIHNINAVSVNSLELQ